MATPHEDEPFVSVPRMSLTLPCKVLDLDTYVHYRKQHLAKHQFPKFDPTRIIPVASIVEGDGDGASREDIFRSCPIVTTPQYIYDPQVWSQEAQRYQPDEMAAVAKKANDEKWAEVHRKEREREARAAYRKDQADKREAALKKWLKKREMFWEMGKEVHRMKTRAAQSNKKCCISETVEKFMGKSLYDFMKKAKTNPVPPPPL